MRIKVPIVLSMLVAILFISGPVTSAMAKNAGQDQKIEKMTVENGKMPANVLEVTVNAVVPNYAVNGNNDVLANTENKNVAAKRAVKNCKSGYTMNAIMPNLGENMHDVVAMVNDEGGMKNKFVYAFNNMPSTGAHLVS